MKDYIAEKVGKDSRNRIIWGLWSCKRGNGKPVTWIGNFNGDLGKSGLRKIRDLLAYSGKKVSVHRIVKDQIVFRVKK